MRTDCMAKTVRENWNVSIYQSALAIEVLQIICVDFSETIIW